MQKSAEFMSRPKSSLRRVFNPMLGRVADFARDERGVTMIEFGILAIPFFTIIAAIFQTAIMFLVAQVLDSALEDASRQIRTGQAASFTLDSFKTLMCDSTYDLIDCSQIKLQSQVIASFADVSQNVPQTCNTTTCTWTTGWEGFVPGAGRNVVQVSAYYRYPLMITLPYFNLKNQPDNYRLLGAIRVFRNEPFS